MLVNARALSRAIPSHGPIATGAAAPNPEPAPATDDVITPSDMLKKVNATLRAYADGEDVELVDVDRRALPENAISSQTAVANFAVLVKGLTLGVSLWKPLLLSGAFVAYWLKEPRVAAYCGLRRSIEPRTAADCLTMLRKWGVLIKVDQVKTRRGRVAYLYELAPVDGGSPEVAGRGAQQPHASEVDDPLVAGAELEAPIGAGAAAGDVTAGGGIGLHDQMMPHAEDDSGARVRGNHYSEEVWR